MPLAGPINDAHPAAPDFFQNLIIAYAPIGVTHIQFAKHVIKRFVFLTIGTHSLSEEATEAKTSADARRRSTLWTGCGLFLEIGGNARRVH